MIWAAKSKKEEVDMTLIVIAFLILLVLVIPGMGEVVGWLLGWICALGVIVIVFGAGAMFLAVVFT